MRPDRENNVTLMNKLNGLKKRNQQQPSSLNDEQVKAIAKNKKRSRKHNDSNQLLKVSLYAKAKKDNDRFFDKVTQYGKRYCRIDCQITPGRLHVLSPDLFEVELVPTSQSYLDDVTEAFEANNAYPLIESAMVFENNQEQYALVLNIRLYSYDAIINSCVTSKTRANRIGAALGRDVKWKKTQ